jgi:hypothetical protein
MDMSDIKRLLDQTGRSAEAPPPPDVVEADVRRGRSALLRRRRRRAIWSSVASTLTVAALVGAAVVIGSSGDTEESPSVRPDPAPSQQREPGVRLVAYTGEQDEGFTVDKVPEDWSVQASEHPGYYLTIAPEGDTSSPENFEGKLVVMLDNRWPKGLPKGEPVEVNGHPGVIFRHDPAGDQLIFEYGDGRFVVVQSWNPTLDWYDDQLVQFAEGVTVTAEAKAGVG